MADGSGRCPACGAPVTSHVAGSFCAACLVALALDEDEEALDESGAGGGPLHAYQVVSVLGREPGRTRYLARRQDFHAFVSLEIIDRSALADVPPERIDERLAQLRRLRHPAIARLLESWREASGDWCLVSDYLAGRALAGGLRLPPGENAAAPALAVFDRVCDALAWAHRQGVVHGRFGPDSIVLVGRDAEFEPRLTGFTVAAPPPALDDDLAGLGRVLVTLAASQPFAAHAAALADQASREGATLETIRGAAHRLLSWR